MKKLIGVFLLAFFLAPLQLAYAKKSGGIIVMDVDLSHHPADKKVRLWLPYPTSSQYQDITSVRISGDFAQSAVHTDNKYQTPMLYAEWPAGTISRHLTVSFKAERQEVVRRDFPEKESSWDQADYAMWLTPSSLGPIDGPVKTLADSITLGKTTVQDKAKAIYDWICDNMFRDPETIGCGTGDVCTLLHKPGGKCTDIHSVFVALCRAAGVPAREVFGVRLGKEDTTDITSWQHCWAEFYLPGYGWVPVDPADVRKMMLKDNLSLGDPKTAELRRTYWGAWDSDRVQLALGRDLILNPRQDGQPLNTFGYPYAEVDGKPLDFYNPATFKYTITCYRLSEDGYGLIDTKGLKELMDRNTQTLVFDARNPEEYQEVHLKGAQSLPLKEFDTFKNLLPKDQSRLVIFYCNGVKCGKSKKSAQKAMSLGYSKILIYAEGMPVWEEKGLPIYTGPDYEKKIETTKIIPADLHDLINSNSDTFIIVDVRDPEEFTAGHIPGATNIPVATFAEQSGTLDKKKRIIVYCNSGGRSYNAYRKLMKLGYDNINQAIFADWTSAGLPIKK